MLNKYVSYVLAFIILAIVAGIIIIVITAAGLDMMAPTTTAILPHQTFVINNRTNYQDIGLNNGT